MVDDEHRSALERLGYEARKRGGCFTRQQAYAEGVTAARFHHLTSTGVIVPVHPRRAVFRFAGTPTSWESDLHAGLLIASPAAVVSHRSAARLWGLQDFATTSAIDLSVRARKSRRHIDGVTVHLTKWLPEDQVVKVGAVDRVTAVGRTIRDLARYLPHDRLLPVAVDACRRKLTDPEELVRCHLEMGRAWGLRTMESVLEMLDAGCLRAASVPELDLHVALIGDDRFPPHVLNHPVTLRSGRRVVFDVAWPDLLAAAEVDSERYHGIDYDRRRDAARDEATRADGWVVERVSTAELGDMAGTLDRLCGFIAEARRTLGSRYVA